MKYIKQLDTIRAIAVLLVIVEHWVPEGSRLNFLVSGAMGVDIFFVLSGFLITSILIDNKIKAEQSPAIPKGSIFKNFYLRRTLRIFPIYYLTIFFLLIFHERSGTHIKENFVYFLTYTSNIYFYKIQSWDGIVSHLWSLAVEEQFYIIWPFIILLVRKRYLLPVIISTIAIALITQFIWHKTEFDNKLVFQCFDSFGLGALLSWIIFFKPQQLERFYKVIRAVGILSSAVLFLQLFKPVYTPFSARTLHSLVALWIITYIVATDRTSRQGFGFILNNKVLLFLGKISYGIYLYHLIIPTYSERYLLRINKHITFLSNKFNLYPFYLENFCLLVLISWLSWKLVEKPILNLKKYFNYRSVSNPQQ